MAGNTKYGVDLSQKPEEQESLVDLVQNDHATTYNIDGLLNLIPPSTNSVPSMKMLGRYVGAAEVALAACQIAQPANLSGKLTA